MKKLLISLFIILLSFSAVWAEGSFEETMEDLSGIAAEGYVGPIVSAFGTNMNGGWFHKVPNKKFLNIDLEFGVVVMGTVFPKDDEFFNVNGDFTFTKDQAASLTSDYSSTPEIQDALIESIINQSFNVGISGPTIIGPADDEIKIEFHEHDLAVTYEAYGQSITDTLTVPGQQIGLGVGGLLEDMPILPLVAPQIGIGSLFGTKIYARYLPTMDMGNELGELSYVGFGIQHNVKAWLPVPLPIDLCLAFYTQKLDMGKYVSASATTFGVNAGKTLGFRFLNITPYAGFMLEESKMKFEYDYEIGISQDTDEVIKQHIEFELEGENKSRLILGLAFRLGVFNLSADYNIGKYESLTANFGMAF